MSVQDLSSRLSQMSPAHRALFEKALRERSAAGRAPARAAERSRVTPRPRGETVPLSMDQERLWFIQQLTPHSPAYNVYGADRLRGPLDVAVLTQALNELVRRHEILRTTFPAVDGLPVQRIAPPFRIAIPVADLTALPVERRAAEAERATAQAVSVPFDLTLLPLLRLVLVQVAAEDHVAAIAIHHIVTDWISYYAMARELSLLYSAFLAGEPSPLPPLEIQFADFALWQRERLADERWMAEQLAWWRERLAGAPELLQLPADRPRPPVQTPWGGRRRLHLSRTLSEGLRSLAQREGVTLFVAALTVFKALLMRLTGEERLIVGTPSAGRQGPEMQEVLGFFLNQIALFTDLSGDPTFREALRRVRDTALGAYDHADVPFARVIEEVRPERDLSRTPLIQIIFLLLNYHELERPPMTGVEVEPYWVDARRTAWDMTFSLWEQETGLTGWMEHNTDQFDAASIDRMKEQFRAILAGALADPERPLWDLPMLPEGQRQQVVCEWPVGEALLAETAGTLARVAGWAARGSDAVAVRQGDVQVTRGELERRAEAMAGQLRRLGVGPESVVGVELERSPEMVAALLGVWKAGAAYLPLDPGHPEERRAALLADGRAVAMADRPGEARPCSAPSGAPALPPPQRVQSPAPAEPHPGDGATVVDTEALAYVLYTSGSTGRPKGVEVTHGGLAAFLGAMRERPGMGPGDRLLAVTTISFDIAGLELYLPLTSGAEVVLADRETAADGTRLAALMAEVGVTVMQATPATWRLLLAGGWQGDGRLKALCGGEALPWDLAEELARRCGEVWNLYGPTETTIWSAVHRYGGERDGVSGVVSIGGPIAGTRLYVLDRRMRPAPVGVAGELAIGGAGLARGYRGRPDLTAERFVPDPLDGSGGGRLYRTGDLVRWRPHGSLEFLGRTDQQVKVRGFRIEPAEVEGALASHPAIAQAVVLARGEGGERHLAAFVVTSPPAADIGDWRGHLRALLPEYMVPSSLTRLEAFPLTPSGKVDRRALLRLEAASEVMPEVRAAGDTLEGAVAAVLAEVLGRPALGPEDHFFQLGGHSLSAFQAVARLRDLLGADLPVSLLFAHPTPAKLAAALATRLADEGEVAPPLVRRPHGLRGDGAPLSFAQQRLWFLDRLVPGNPFYNMYFGLRIGGRLEAAALAAALAELARRHEVLRTRFADPAGKGEPVQQVDATVELPLPEVDLRALPEVERERELARLSTAEARRPFDLGRAPLARTVLVRLGARLGQDDQALLLSLHHIVTDGWSMRVLASDLGTLYGAAAAGVSGAALSAVLPELPLQYADYAAWQRQWLEGPVLEEQVAAWRERLAGAPALLELPLDRPRPRVAGFRGDAEALTLPPALETALRSLAARHGATLFMALLAGWDILLARVCRQSDFLVGTPVANRPRRQLEGLIGLFVNTLVLRAELEGEPSAVELLARLRRTVLEALARPHLPFERLVVDLSPERDLGHNPLVQVMFSMQSFTQARPQLSGLDVTPLGGDVLDAGTSKLDLVLYAWDEAVPGSGLRLRLEYDSDLFDAATVRRLLASYETLLTALAAQPGMPVDQLPLLPGAGRAEILAQGAARTVPAPARCLHERFRAWAAERPAAPAVTWEGTTWTFGRLARRAGWIARRLRILDVGPETRVALRFDRGPDLVAAILGVLEAGGAYVPVEPSLPEERQAYLIADSGARVLLDGTGGAPPSGPVDVRVVPIGGELDEGEEIPPPLPGGAWPESTAYVIYTSGSTGMPKGVAVAHAQVDRLLSSTAPWFGFGPDDVWTLFHSYAFDFSVWEIWGALAHGGRLVIVPYLTSRSPEALAELLEGEAVTVLNQTPSAFYQLAAWEEETGRLAGPALRHAVFGGEALDPGRLAGWLARHGDSRPRLANMYGITETTVHVTWQPLTADDITRPGSPIGVAIPDLSLHLLDAHLEPVPWGVAGEIHVGGAGVARGYPGRPALTAERFLPDPFAGEQGARLYRSGDLARRRPDGSLDYLGRADRQVKVRGFRIEPGEIESALAQHPLVSEAAVAARRDQGDDRLVAYVVPAAGERFAVAALRDHLAARLPSYMLPAAWVTLDALPLTRNGKLDRAALPAPAGDRPELAGGYTSPRGFLEETLAAVWASVLGVGRVGIDDNFFALGGDSIRSLQVLSQARELGIELTLADLFLHQTVAALAAVAAERQASGAGAGEELPDAAPFSLVSEEDRRRLPAGVVDAYPLTLLQAGMLFHMQATAEYPLYHNVDSRSARIPLDLPLLRQAFDRVVARHPVLRTAFDLTAYSEPLQLVYESASMEIGCEDLRHLSVADREARLAAFVQAEKRRLFDLSRPPLLRFHVHRLTDEWVQLTLTECHPIFDGWSLNSSLVEVFEAYLSAVIDGTPLGPPAAPPRATLRDFVALERQALASSEQRDFWRGKVLAGPVTDLPARFYPRGPLGEETGPRSQVRFEVERPVHDGLARLARSLGVPFKSVCLAAHLRVLSLITGETSPLTGVVLNGRPETVDGFEARGLFLNTMPLRLPPAGGRDGGREGGTWAGLVRRTFEAERELFPYRRYPFAALQQWWGREPLLQSAVNYTHFHVWAEVRAHGWDLDTGMGFAIELEENHYPLMVNFNYEEELPRLRVWVESRMEEPEARKLLEIYERVLAALALSPEARSDEADLLAEAERAQVLREWSGVAAGVAETAPAASIPVRFVAQAARTPDRVAVTAGGVLVSYAELERRSARLAWWLRAAGAGPETRVAVALERGPELVTALLAVLRSGAAYIPLDLSQPAERRDAMLRDAQADLRLTREEMAGLPAPGAGDGAGDLDLPVPEPDSLAYVLYTSGSTGRPKGVAIPHRGPAALLGWADAAFSEEEVAGVLASTSVGFDLSVFELFMPLGRGGTVVLADNAFALADLPARDAVTLVNTVPSAAAELLRAGALPASARTLCLAGEPLRGAMVRQAWETPGVERVWNLYGPSEDTTYSTGARLERNDFDGQGEPPIGRPVAGSRAWVLDEGLQPLPAGVPGELCLAGPGLARGYLGRPDMTAAAFVPDPWSGSPGARLYRTGDRVLHRPDGSLEFLGRIDRQVKVRGVRVEPGEVEAALLSHPAVRQVVVLALTGSDADGTAERRLAAFLVPAGDLPAESALRAFLRERLPEAMVPRLFVPLPELPLTPNGKVDRRALSQLAQTAEAPAPGAGTAELRGELERAIAAVWREVLGRDRVGADDNFFDLGGHSLLLLRVQGKLRQALGRDVGVVELFRHPTVASLARALASETPAPEAAPAARPAPQADPRIAVIGMAGRFPGAADVDELWRNLCAGVEGISRLSDAQLAAAGVPAEALRDPRYVKATGALQGFDLFDADFFGFVPRDAEVTDPQHRLFLEHAWEALEHAGYAPGSPGAPGRGGDGRLPVGVFAGSGMSGYLRNLLSRPEVVDAAGMLKIGLANDKDHLPTTVSYKLNLKGPSIAVQTACSTSLVAVHMACRSLLAGECDMALAGGVSVPVPHGVGYLYQEGGILSPDGHCRAFDARAQGSVSGSGVGVVVLKRLADALADGDTVHAVILGSAVNNDAALRVGYTAPGVEGQAEVIAAALAAARVDPRSITYVEAHGTGTALGDPIEVAALTQAFRTAGAAVGNSASGFCALGSIKTNIGHADAAAGVAGLIKTVLALEHGQIPPSLHFEAPNAEIDLAASPFRVNTRLAPWQTDGAPRRAGVSSFGLGGTNAHVVLEEPPAVPVPEEETEPRWHLLPLSARTGSALAESAARLRRHLLSRRVSLADVAFTLQMGRRPFAHRLAVLARTPAEAAALLAPGAADPADLPAVARHWIAGGDVDWTALHSGRRRRVPLPTYPFERRRFWVEPARLVPEAGSAAPIAEPGEREVADLFYVPSWRRLPLASALPPTANGRWLVFLDEAGLGERLLEHLAGAEAVTVRAGAALARVGERAWTIDPRRREDYDALLADALDGSLPTRVLHLWSVDAMAPAPDFASGAGLATRMAALERAEDLGLYSLLYLIQAANERAAGESAVEITVVTTGAQWVAGGDLVAPEKATVAGVCRVAPVEIPGLACRHVDLEVPAARAFDGRLAARLAAEVLAPVEPVVAYRQGERWVQRFEPLRLEAPQPSPFAALAEHGAWLITGGTGGVGLALAERLAEVDPAAGATRLVLVGRSAEVPAGDPRGERLHRLRALGAEVVAADVADPEALRAVTAGVVERHGRIAGIVHAAGVAGGGLLTLRRRDELEAEMAAKVRGALALGDLCRELAPDVVVLVSSLSSFEAALGQTGYCAANSFLDAYGAWLEAAGGPRTLVINWSRWRGVGMAAAFERRHRRITGQSLPGGLAESEAVESFERALASGVSQVIVAERPPGTQAMAARAAGATAAAAPVYPRPDLFTPYVEPADELEREIAELWQEAFGIERIGVHDDFFELGGDSLFALRLAARLSETFGLELRVRDLFAVPTVAGLAALVQDAMLAAAAPDELGRALADLEAGA